MAEPYPGRKRFGVNLMDPLCGRSNMPANLGKIHLRILKQCYNSQQAATGILQWLRLGAVQNRSDAMISNMIFPHERHNSGTLVRFMNNRPSLGFRNRRSQGYPLLSANGVNKTHGHAEARGNLLRRSAALESFSDSPNFRLMMRANRTVR